MAVASVMVVAFLLPGFTTSTTLAKLDVCVCGFITENTTWTEEESPYIVSCGVLVVEGVTLTIEPGVLVRFDQAKGMQIEGQLIANGTEEKPIVFTSNQTAPAPGDWINVLFTDTSIDATYDEEGNYVSGSIMQHCTIEYGGGSDTPALRMISSSPLINYCNVTNNGNTGIEVDMDDVSLLKITNSVIANNSGRGIYARVRDGMITISGNTITGNSASHGGGILFDTWYGTVTISGNTITDNSVSQVRVVESTLGVAMA